MQGGPAIGRRGGGQTPAAGLEPGLVVAPQLQKRRRPLGLGPCGEGPLLPLRQHPPSDRRPVEPRPQPLHIDPHRAMAMQGDHDQIARMAEVEGRPAGAVGLAMGSHHERHGGGGAAQLGRQQSTQAPAGPQKTVLIVWPPQGRQPLPLRRRQAGPQGGGQGRREGLTALDQQQQRLRRGKAGQGGLVGQVPGARTEHRLLFRRRRHRPGLEHPT
mgnify:CR=1 FL=1